MAPFHRTARVIDIVREPKDYLDLFIGVDTIPEEALPGQFVMVRGWPGLDPLLPRPFDIVQADPGGHTLRLVFKIVGRGTRFLGDLKRGDSFQVTGPLGRGITDFSVSSLALLARGAGAAAVVFLAREAYRRGIEVFTFLSAANADRLICREYLEPVSTRLEVATDDGSAGYQGNATDLLDRLLAQRSIARVCSCGSRRFARYVKRLDANRTVQGFVFLEGLMACGMGDCHGCAVQKAEGPGYYLVCTDGPFFPVDRVVLE